MKKAFEIVSKAFPKATLTDGMIALEQDFGFVCLHAWPDGYGIGVYQHGKKKPVPHDGGNNEEQAGELFVGLVQSMNATVN
jgi:hypothetical protein